MKTNIAVLSLTIFIAIFIANTAVALPPPTPRGGVPVPATDVSSIQTIFDRIVNLLGWVYTIFFVIAAFFILFAAFTYLTAKGDPEKVKGARDQIIYAAIAIVVALLAFSIDQIISTFVIGG